MHTTTTTRRAMLAGAAVLPALATSQALANFSSLATSPDPIFAALDAYRRVQADDRPGMSDDEIDEYADRWYDALHLVVETVPTSPAGLAALTGFAHDTTLHLGDNGSEWGCGNLTTLLTTIDTATRGMTGLAPWSPPAATVTGADPIFAAIEAHRAAMMRVRDLHDEEFRLEAELPFDRRRWAWNSEESLDDAAKHDDHRWLENCIQGHHAFEHMDALAMEFIRVRATTAAGVAALLSYVAGELATGRSDLPPNMPDVDEDETDDDKPGDGPILEHRWLVPFLQAAADALAALPAATA